MVLVLGIVKASLEVLGIGIGVKKSGIAHVCCVKIMQKNWFGWWG